MLSAEAIWEQLWITNRSPLRREGIGFEHVELYTQSMIMKKLRKFFRAKVTPVYHYFEAQIYSPSYSLRQHHGLPDYVPCVHFDAHMIVYINPNMSPAEQQHIAVTLQKWAQIWQDCNMKMSVKLA